jgi:hypothetical protein
VIEGKLEVDEIAIDDLTNSNLGQVEVSEIFV